MNITPRLQNELVLMRYENDKSWTRGRKCSTGTVFPFPPSLLMICYFHIS
jgi:hypothetical protein